jgi:hypothetical protein
MSLNSTPLPVEAGIVALLAGNEGVSVLVGPNIFPLALPAAFTNFPAITYTVMPSKAVVLLDGELGEQTARIRFKCHGVRYEDASGVQAAIHAALDTYAATLSNDTVIQAVEPSDGTDFFLADQRIFGRSCEFIFHFN